MARPERPDFIIVGAPKAGTTALHSALAQHPEVFTTTPKEPKYWLCGDAPPPHWIGPGDAHSQQEWVWRRRDYDALFRPAAGHQVRGESTPFYLWSYPAHRRIAEHLPDVKLIAVVRDPIDRAYSNWMHLWSDGLERSRTAAGLSPSSSSGIDAGSAGAVLAATKDLGCVGDADQHSSDPSRARPARCSRWCATAMRREHQPVADAVCRFLGIRVSGYVEPGIMPPPTTRAAYGPAWAGAQRVSSTTCAPAAGLGPARPDHGGAVAGGELAQLGADVDRPSAACPPATRPSGRRRRAAAGRRTSAAGRSGTG